MTIDQPAFDPMEEQTSPTQFVPEPPEMPDELPTAKAEFPILLKIEFDPLELGGAEDFNHNAPEAEEVFAVYEPEDTVAVPMEFLETPEGYTAPQFDDFYLTDDVNSFDATAETNHDLDALFAELSDSASGQSADVAVWCPWLVDAT